MKRLLLVEDEEVILKALRRLLERNHYEVEVATTVEQALAAQPQTFDLILADLRLPGDEGTSIVPAAETVPVVIMTSHASVRSAVDAMRCGATDYIAKPFDHDELLMTIERALMQNMLQAQNRALRRDVQRAQSLQRHLAGSRIETLFEQLQRDHSKDKFLHLYGERGTDREGLARIAHGNSSRADAPLVVADVSRDTVNSDAMVLLSNNSTEHKNGLPAGGLLQTAHNGTLVLRHPEQLDDQVQKQLVEALSKPRVNTFDNSRSRIVNTTLVTIGHDSIEQLQAANQIIPELAELLIANQFEVPPLRERREDIMPLAQLKLRALETRYGFKRMKFSPQAESSLVANHWSGNIEELDSVLTRAVFASRNQTISVQDLGFSQVDLSLDEYFRYFVLNNQASLSETDLAARLGISRKALWERRQKTGLIRSTNDDLSS